MTTDKLLEFYNKIVHEGMDVSVIRQLRNCSDKEIDTPLSVFVQEMLDKTQASQIGIEFEQFATCGSCEEIADILSDCCEFEMYVSCSSGNSDEEEEEEEEEGQ